MIRKSVEIQQLNADQHNVLADLPAAPVPQLADAITGRRVVAHAEFDLDETLRYARRFVVLVEGSIPRAAEADAAVVYTRADGSTVEVAVADLAEAQLKEALGLDRLILLGRDGSRHELPFSRRFRLEMSRFHQRLSKRIEHDAGPDLTIPTGEDDPDDESEFDTPKRKVLMRLLEVAQPYRGRIAIALGLTVASSVLNVLPAFLTMFVIDQAVNPMTTAGMSVEQRLWNLGFWVSLYTLAAFAMFLSYWGRLKTLSYVGSHVAGDLRDKVYRHLHSLSMRYFGKHRVGSLITRVTSDTDRLWDFIVFGSVDFIKNVLMMVAAAALMAWADWRLALIALSPVPFVAVLTWWKSQVMTRLFGRLWTYWSRLTAVVGDAIPGVKVVKAFASEEREVSRFARRNSEFTNDEYSAVRVWVNLQPVVEGTMMISRIIILIAGGWFIIRAGDSAGSTTLGTLVMFLSIVGFFHMAIQDLAQKQRMVTRAATSAQRVFEVLDTRPEITSKSGALTPAKIEGSVEFRDVSFSYDGTKPVLRLISLKVAPGQMVGLCGHSGAGKSTFVNLISRFYDVSDGALLIDGVDVRDYDLQWLRSHVGVVLQDPYLFYGTIADNIRYGKPEASPAEVIESARAANAHDFIVALPDGYDTLVGERGQSLSGGERQRVSIARAILHNPKVLVLDEATSSVDTKTERQIQEALDRLMAGRTTFAIAHRLSTLRNANLIVVLDQGRVVETGTHEELLASSAEDADGHYARLYKAQADIAADMLVEA